MGHHSDGHAKFKLNGVPLSFLPTFEAAGRLGSFAAAAAALHLTPSAISQQIRALEAALGVALFVRNGRHATLTRDGECYLQEVGLALEQLAVASARLRGQSQGPALRLSTFSLFAHEFLLPRMPQFRASFPELALRVENANDYIDFRVSECDAAVRIGSGSPELTVHPLGSICAAVVCAPRLASGIRELADLRNYTLLDADGEGARGYAALMEAHGVPAQPQNVWHFETCLETLSAAEHGLGFAFALFPIATHWINTGRLAVPLAERVPMSSELNLVHRPADATRFAFDALAAWLRTQYLALPALDLGRTAAAAGTAQPREPFTLRIGRAAGRSR
jgi:LysR family glycine cleavage system transcriptional activator